MYFVRIVISAYFVLVLNYNFRWLKSSPKQTNTMNQEVMLSQCCEVSNKLTESVEKKNKIRYLRLAINQSLQLWQRQTHRVSRSCNPLKCVQFNWNIIQHKIIKRDPGLYKFYYAVYDNPLRRFKKLNFPFTICRFCVSLFIVITCYSSSVLLQNWDFQTQISGLAMPFQRQILVLDFSDRTTQRPLGVRH